MMVAGFRAAAGAAGIKTPGTPDLALIVAAAPVSAAGVFTRNRVKAAPVLLCRQRLRRGVAQAVLVNSGNANACTGPLGLRDARLLTRETARLLGVPEVLVLPASTGVIGQPLPVDRIKRALPELVARLRPDALEEVARAIMTTDTRPKLAVQEGWVQGKKVTVAGVAKGAGMIHPDLATLLAFILTDAAVHSNLLKTLLRQAVDSSFNRLTVDGDTSTNDTVLLLASGRAGNPELRTAAEAGPLAELLHQVLTDLAKQVAADGEGASRVYEVVVEGAASPIDARKAALAVATSPLVKTAMAGADVNWGRIMAALGRSGARFDPGKVSIAYGGHPVVAQGRGLGAEAEVQARQAILAGPFTVTIHLGAGPHRDFYRTCDLTEEYIRINASYRS